MRKTFWLSKMVEVTEDDGGSSLMAEASSVVQQTGIEGQITDIVAGFRKGLKKNDECVVMIYAEPATEQMLRDLGMTELGTSVKEAKEKKDTVPAQYKKLVEDIQDTFKDK